MGVSRDSKYGKVTTATGHFLLDEPVFILRAKDKNAVAAIRHYAVTCELAGCSDEFIEHLVDEATKFELWQAKNPQVMKDPD